MSLLNRFALGTVQFGLPYGVANHTGQVSRDDALEILNYAQSAGVDTLDTAIAYGTSEQRLGEIGVSQWQVISKLPALPENCPDVTAWVHESVMGSLERLNINRLRGLLLHHPRQLLSSQGDVLYQALVTLKEQGLVEKIGASIYAPDELDALWPHFQLDLVQAPFNIIDRRLATSGWLAKLHLAGTEVHVRSIFLQGLLLMEDAKRPKVFKRWESLWMQWHHWLGEQSLTPLRACLTFAEAQIGIDRIVIGVDSLRQLREIHNATKMPAEVPPPALMSEDLDLINPSRWNML